MADSAIAETGGYDPLRWPSTESRIVPELALQSSDFRGSDRELKLALERFWRDEIDEAELRAIAADLRAANWLGAAGAGIDVVPCGDFSYYDQVLDTAWALGAIPARFGQLDRDRLSDYFVLARGAGTSARSR